MLRFGLESGNISSSFYVNNYYSSNYFVENIDLERELKGHAGCVNCLNWNSTGQLLASGSDDQNIFLWKPFDDTEPAKIRTGHRGNIFSVKFMPMFNEYFIVTGAGDGKICVHDLNTSATAYDFSCNEGRIKRLDVQTMEPFLFWSAAEDGTIRQYDLREPENTRNVLVNLIEEAGRTAEARCLACSPTEPFIIAVGANDHIVRLYDRRQLTLKRYINNRTLDPSAANRAKYFSPYSLARKVFLQRKRSPAMVSAISYSATYVSFSQDGSQLLANIGGDAIYQFSVKAPAHLPAKPDNLESIRLLRSPGARTGDFYTRFPLPIDRGTTNPNIETEIMASSAKLLRRRKFTAAIVMHNEALRENGFTPRLLLGRAVSQMCRGWAGDAYQALLDCQHALAASRGAEEERLRLTAVLLTAACLLRLRWPRRACSLLHDLRRSDVPLVSAIAQPLQDLEERANKAIGDDQALETDDVVTDRGFDYSARFTGHCNTTTEIKEAVFFGQSNEYVIAGSDCGTFFLWDRASGNVRRILRADSTTVNCVQPHPFTCLIATSGIDSTIKLWSPLHGDDTQNAEECLLEEKRRTSHAVRNVVAAVEQNQVRLRVAPLEQLMFSLGYNDMRAVLGGSEFDSEEESGSRSENGEAAEEAVLSNEDGGGLDPPFAVEALREPAPPAEQDRDDEDNRLFRWSLWSQPVLHLVPEPD